jgi:hypothetical protein
MIHDVALIYTAGMKMGQCWKSSTTGTWAFKAVSLYVGLQLSFLKITQIPTKGPTGLPLDSGCLPPVYFLREQWDCVSY